jgi:outer membrane protein OmpA-like peptidoglycan-associated protein
MTFALLGFYSEGSAQEEFQVTGPEQAAKLTFQTVAENKILVSILDAEENPVLDLQPEDFVIKKGPKNAKILTVEPLATSKEIGLNIVLVVDNSFSMKQRRAIQPLFAALEEFFKIVRPIDNIHVVVFDQKNTMDINGRKLHARTLQSSNLSELRSFFRQSFKEGLTEGTFLYDGIVAGLDIVDKMPEKANKFLVVFTDGEDINSSVTTANVQAATEGIPNFSAYALDFTKKPTVDTFLKFFAETNEGRIWKASSSVELTPIFKAFSTTLLHRYVISYRFLTPPQGTLALEPEKITIEEVTTIDSSPLLNFVYFGEGMSEISAPYILFSNQADTRSFSEENLRGTQEKYHHLLNIIGSRLTKHPEAKITIQGCNSNRGIEKGDLALSRGRAESIRAYLRYIWGIDPARMEIKARNLPSAPSTGKVAEAVVDNQRAEIYSDDPAILDTVKSTYVENKINTKTVRFLPVIQSEAGIVDWKMYLKGGDGSVISTFSGQEEPISPVFDLETVGIDRVASLGSMTAGIEVRDKEGEGFQTESSAIPVEFIKRRELMAKKMGYRVLEKYALILFDYDSEEIKARNKIILDRIIKRMKELPGVEAKIVGHTDSIGKEEYNLNLSERRAKAVYIQAYESGMAAGGNVTFVGMGPYEPLYDNATPEGRAMNRTVTITLEYEGK